MTKTIQIDSEDSKITRKRVGRPRNEFSLSSRLRDYLVKNPIKAQQIMLAWINMIIRNGNPVALKELLDRLEGKVIERHELEAKIPVNLIFTPFPVREQPKLIEARDVVEGEGKLIETS